LNRSVIDASLVLKWYLADEEFGETSLRLLQRYLDDEIELLAPTLLEYEIMNALVYAQRKGRIEPENISLALEGFFDLGMDLAPVANLFPRILFFCQTYKCSAYDSSYLALAEAEGIDLITADRKLFATVKTDLKWVKWIGDL
jgi:predicted nucleic acid-binding protein